MRVLILRHGQAEHRTRPDEARRLDAVGEDEIKQAAAFIARYQPDYIWVSPYQRTQETAALVLEALANCAVETCEELTPDANPWALIERLPEQGTVLLISHMPFVSALGGLLTDGVVSAGKRFKTGQVRVLEADVAGIGLFEQTAKFSR